MDYEKIAIVEAPRRQIRQYFYDAVGHVKRIRGALDAKQHVGTGIS
jgi:hypothetical protein